MKRPTSIAERLLLLEKQVDELMAAKAEEASGPRSPARRDNQPQRQAGRGPYLGPAISQRIHEALWGAGFDTLEKLRAASDEELLAVPGVGRSTLTHIRTALE